MGAQHYGYCSYGYSVEHLARARHWRRSVVGCHEYGSKEHSATKHKVERVGISGVSYGCHACQHYGCKDNAERNVPCDDALPQHEGKSSYYSKGEQVGTFYSIAHTRREHRAARTHKRYTDAYNSRVDRIAPYSAIDEFTQAYCSNGSEGYCPERRTYRQTEGHYECCYYSCAVGKSAGATHHISSDKPL